MCFDVLVDGEAHTNTQVRYTPTAMGRNLINQHGVVLLFPAPLEVVTMKLGCDVSDTAVCVIQAEDGRLNFYCS